MALNSMDLIEFNGSANSSVKLYIVLEKSWDSNPGPQSLRDCALPLNLCYYPPLCTLSRSHKKCSTYSFLYIYTCLNTLHFVHLGGSSLMS